MNKLNIRGFITIMLCCIVSFFFTGCPRIEVVENFVGINDDNEEEKQLSLFEMESENVTGCDKYGDPIQR